MLTALNVFLTLTIGNSLKKAQNSFSQNSGGICLLIIAAYHKICKLTQQQVSTFLLLLLYSVTKHP